MNKNQLLIILGVIVVLLLVGGYLYTRPKPVSDATITDTVAPDMSAPVTPEATTTMGGIPAQLPTTPPVRDTSPNPATVKIKGLKVETLTPGSGPRVTSGQTISVDYTGMFTDGKVFDSSIPRGAPLTVALGKSQVIKGWDLGIVGMKVGEKRRLTIDPELAYGEAGFPGAIPPNTTLVFEITLLSIK